MTADKQLKAYIDRVLRLKEEQDTIGDDIREIYAEAKAEGYDKTIMGKVVAHLRRELKKGSGAVDEAEMVFDTYLTAYRRASGTPVATHTHEENYDRETGEILDGDANAKLVATVATGMQTEIGRKALIAAVDIMIARGEAEEEFHTNPDEEGEAKGAPSVEAEDRAEGDTDRQRSPEAGTTDGGRQGAREQADSSPVPASNSETDPSEDRSEGQSLDGGLNAVGANTGGSHVDGSVERAPGQQQGNTSNTAGGTVSNPPAKPLRPHCFRPENCGGYGSHECFSCRKAAKANDEEAA